jgi:uncharacterized protein YdeI (BOF family)
VKGKRRTRTRVAALAFTTVCVLGLTAGTVFAAVTQIGTVVADPSAYKDQAVSVTGTIDKVVEGNEYILNDGTGTIAISGGPAWHKLLGLTVGQSVTVTGEVDLGKDGKATAPELDILTVEADGQTTTVREAGKRPAWAGGPFKNGQTPGQGVPDTDDATPEVPDTDATPEVPDTDAGQQL